MIFPGFPGVLSFFQIEWKPWNSAQDVSSRTSKWFSKASQCRLLYIASKLKLRLVRAQLNSLIHPISSRTCNLGITLKLGSFAEALSEFLTEKYLLSFSSVLERSGKYLIILMAVLHSARLSLRPGRRKRQSASNPILISPRHSNMEICLVEVATCSISVLCSKTSQRPCLL